MKYDISYEINDILLVGQKFKRQGKYKEAEEVYEYILKIDGPSGLLFIAIAKLFACQLQFEEAIKLLQLANIACIEENDIEDLNCLYHIDKLQHRYDMTRDEFLKYMRTIAGNDEYNFPKEY